MKLNLEFLGTFNTTHRMHVGRSYERHVELNTKPVKSPAELDEFQKLTSFLLPYSTTPPEPEPRESSIRQQRAAHAADATGVILNQQKLAEANLSGSQGLQVHRQSLALAKLMSLPLSVLSAQQKSELVKLKNALVGYVGLTGEAGKESDFRVAR